MPSPARYLRLLLLAALFVFASVAGGHAVAGGRACAVRRAEPFREPKKNAGGTRGAKAKAKKAKKAKKAGEPPEGVPGGEPPGGEPPEGEPPEAVDGLPAKQTVTEVDQCTVWGPVLRSTAVGGAGDGPAWAYRRGRYQYDQNNGYCGEVSLQVLMLEHGVWIPQEAARAAGGGELLPGLNYDRALQKLGVAYDAFKGGGYGEFMRWTKAQLQKGLGVVTVGYFAGGRDAEYDHIMPIVAYKSCPAGDSVFVNSNYDTRPVERALSDFSCTKNSKRGGIKTAGCVPRDTRWGYAIKGPARQALGPRVELFVENPREPGLGKSATMAARLRAVGLEPGRRYVLHRTPGPPASAVDVARASQWSQAFTAEGAQHAVAVAFKSDMVAHFVCLPA